MLHGLWLIRLNKSMIFLYLRLFKTTAHSLKDLVYLFILLGGQNGFFLPLNTKNDSCFEIMDSYFKPAGLSFSEINSNLWSLVKIMLITNLHFMLVLM